MLLLLLLLVLRSSLGAGWALVPRDRVLPAAEAGAAGRLAHSVPRAITKKSKRIEKHGTARGGGRLSIRSRRPKLTKKVEKSEKQ